MRRAVLAILVTLVIPLSCMSLTARADQRAYGRVWGKSYSNEDWNRFYHYPYVFYPQNYWGNEYYRSAESLYFRYPPEMQIPVYNKKWQNELPQPRRYHWGHHFQLDVF